MPFISDCILSHPRVALPWSHLGISRDTGSEVFKLLLKKTRRNIWIILEWWKEMGTWTFKDHLWTWNSSEKEHKTAQNYLLETLLRSLPFHQHSSEVNFVISPPTFLTGFSGPITFWFPLKTQVSPADGPEAATLQPLGKMTQRSPFAYWGWTAPRPYLLWL